MNVTFQQTHTGVFESFNARSLTPEQVANTFVPPLAFANLARRVHATVIGPRGSGKTSLLKMLQPRALENWSTAEGEKFRQSIDYTGVFVPTDISWNQQTSAIVVGLPEKLVRLFRGAAFTTHLLHELLEAFCWRTEPSPHTPYRRVAVDPQKQRDLARQLATAWNLTPSTQTLMGIKHALSARHAQIWTLAQRLSLLGDEPNSLPDWLAFDALSQTSFAIELFDDMIGEPGGRWALLFDELELAPDWVMRGLLAALRSTNPKLIYKLAISPYNESYQSLSTALQAVPDQDYAEIRLWYAQKEDAVDFSRRLMTSVCRDAGIAINNPVQLLGTSVLDMEKGGRSYDLNSEQYRVLNQAITNDRTFRRFWISQGIDIDRIAQLSESVRAAKVRKIYPLVAVRNYFRSADGSPTQTMRGRKSLEIYAGASGMLTIAEGNPRWVIGITKSLIDGYQQGIVPRERQAQLVESTIHRFRARLKTIKVNPFREESRNATLLGFLDQIGFYFQQRLIVDDFHPQPPLSFTVDASASEDVVLAIGRAVNSGAIVYVPDKASIALLNDVRGKRFRLSYLLAPHYSLALRLGESIALSRILKSPPVDDQPELGFSPS